MANLITTDLESGERQAERDLGAILNEVAHLTERLTEHATSIEGLKEAKTWIVSHLEALERDLAALPREPGELAATLTQSLSELTSRIERLESSSTESEEHTEAPEREERESDEGRSPESGERKEKSRSLLDNLF
jgi:flagellar biosynthesis/type III secretory pathway chaperone